MTRAGDRSVESSAGQCSGAHALFHRIIVSSAGGRQAANGQLASALAAPEASILVEPATSARELHRAAERHRADLLVVGPDPTAVQHAPALLPGVLHDAPCAVAVTTPDGGPDPLRLNAVGFAFRPTEPGRRGAEFARRIAAAHGAELHGITVVPVTPNLWLGPAASGVQTLARIEGSLDEFARTDLRALGGVVDHVEEGDPIHELRRFSGTVDLLVIGTRSVGRLRRLLIGSTADALSTSARCPLLVVGSGGDRLA